MALGCGKFPVSLPGGRAVPTNSARKHFTSRSKHLCTSRSQEKSMDGQKGLAVDAPASHRVRNIPGCLSSPSCPQGGFHHDILCPPGRSIPIPTLPPGSQEHQEHPWKGREGTVPSSPSWDFSPSTPPSYGRFAPVLPGKTPRGKCPR